MQHLPHTSAIFNLADKITWNKINVQCSWNTRWLIEKGVNRSSMSLEAVVVVFRYTDSHKENPTGQVTTTSKPFPSHSMSVRNKFDRQTWIKILEKKVT